MKNFVSILVPSTDYVFQLFRVYMVVLFDLWIVNRFFCLLFFFVIVGLSSFNFLGFWNEGIFFPFLSPLMSGSSLNLLAS